MTETGKQKMLVIGNGPSARRLAEIGFFRIPSDFDTFGMGAAYRFFSIIDWWPTYYGLCDTKVVYSHRSTLKRLIEDTRIPVRRFFLSLSVATHPTLEVVPHASTGDFCLRKAVELGYREIYLIGVEGNYVEEVTGSRALTRKEQKAFAKEGGVIEAHLLDGLRKIVTNTTHSPNYFFPWYQVKGDIYSLPRAGIHLDKWREVDKFARERRAFVSNLSECSQVDVFERSRLDDLPFLTTSEPGSSAGSQKPLDEALGNHRALVLMPTLRTAPEREFWKNFCKRLSELGYLPVLISILAKNPQQNTFVDFADQWFIVSSPTESLALRHDGEGAEPRQFDDETKRLVSLMTVTHLMRNRVQDYDDSTVAALNSGCRSVAATLDEAIALLNPRVAVVNNDTTPHALLATRFLSQAGIPFIHSERSPFVNQWFEPNGFYACSEAWTVQREPDWAEDPSLDDAGQKEIAKLVENPAMHRSEVGEQRYRGDGNSTISADGRPTFLVVMDHVVNTGWVITGHPRRALNYPLFDTPEQALERIAAVAESHDAHLLVKPHPGDPYFNHDNQTIGYTVVQGSIDKLMEQADIVFCFLSKVAFAALATRKKLVLLAPNIAALSGVAHPCKQVEDLGQVVRDALSHEWGEADSIKVRRFFGWLSQEYMVANDLTNPGAKRILDRYFLAVKSGENALPIDREILEKAGRIPGMISGRPLNATRDGSDATSVLLGSFEREDGHQLDEVEVIHNLFAAGTLAPRGKVGVMLDVGSCKGSAFVKFAERGWAIHAFEPNPPMFSFMQENHHFPGLTLNPLAVSQTTGEDLPFYTSDESIGISSLSPFRDSHKPTAVVKTIRLDEYCANHRIKHIDFLKIDTEGFDLMVLKSLDWDRWQPQAIVCEFEDLKTVKLGYSVQDTVEFLLKRNYTVYISEWHPITRYGGGEHRWRSLRRWAQNCLPENSWGNIMAFRDTLPEGIVIDATFRTLEIARAQKASQASRKKKGALNGMGQCESAEPVDSRDERLWRKTFAKVVKGQASSWFIPGVSAGIVLTLLASITLIATQPEGVGFDRILLLLNASLLSIIFLGFALDSDRFRRRIRKIRQDHAEALTVTSRNFRKVRQSLAKEKKNVTKANKKLELRLASLRKDLEAQGDHLRQSLTAEAGNLLTRVEDLRHSIGGAQKAGEELSLRIEGVEKNMRSFDSRSISLDLMSVLHALRPLWLNVDRLEDIVEERTLEHGHCLMMALLVAREKLHPGALAGRTLIEIGTTREHDYYQSSSEKLAAFTALTGMNFVTVDMDPRNSRRAEKVIRYLNPRAEVVTRKGEDFLARSQALEFVYLDAFDFDHGKHAPERQARYQKILGTTINDDACWKMHEACAQALIEKMVHGGLVVIDDTWTDSDGNVAGKGTLAVPLLLSNGFSTVTTLSRAIALRKDLEDG